MAGNNSQTKQVILMREDLNLSSGKMMAQASHASLSAILNKNTTPNGQQINIDISDEESEWFNERFTKIVLGVKSEEELLKYYNLAKEKGLNVSRPIVDAGFTELKKPTLTCIAIGPNYRESIDEITKKLRVFTGTSQEKKIKTILEKIFSYHSELPLVKELMSFFNK